MNGRVPAGVLAAAATVVLLADPAATPWLAGQRAVARALMPDFELRDLAVRPAGPHRVLQADWTNRRHLVLRGRVFAPGFDFQSQTPLRTAGLLAALPLAGAAALLARRRDVRARSVLPALAAALLLGVVALPVVLAGEVWAVGVEPLSSTAAGAWLAGASRFLLHGGGYLLAALGVAGTAWLAGATAPPAAPASPGCATRRAKARRPGGRQRRR